MYMSKLQLDKVVEGWMVTHEMVLRVGFTYATGIEVRNGTKSGRSHHVSRYRSEKRNEFWPFASRLQV